MAKGDQSAVPGVVALGVGFGAAYPDFKSENPAQSVTSFGGLLFMLLAAGFIAAVIVLDYAREVAAKLRAGGLRDVLCEPIEIPTVFSSFEDYWRPLLGGTGPAPSYVASLDADQRAALAKELEQALPRGPGEKIALTARAWAVRGTAY